MVHVSSLPYPIPCLLPQSEREVGSNTNADLISCQVKVHHKTSPLIHLSLLFAKYKIINTVNFFGMHESLHSSSNIFRHHIWVLHFLFIFPCMLHVQSSSLMQCPFLILQVFTIKDAFSPEDDLSTMAYGKVKFGMKWPFTHTTYFIHHNRILSYYAVIFMKIRFIRKDRLMAIISLHLFLLNNLNNW